MNRLSLMFFLPVFICFSCQEKKGNSVKTGSDSSLVCYMDVGYGEEKFEKNAIKFDSLYKGAFSYNTLSKTGLLKNVVKITKDTVLSFNNNNFFISSDDDQNGYLISKTREKRVIKRNSIIINGKEFRFVNLYYGCDKIPKENRMPEVSSLYIFSYGADVYLLAFIAPVVTNSTTTAYKGLLVNLSDKQQGEGIAFPNYQLSNSYYCINDFDGDGKLDYACLNANEYKVTLYHIEKGKLLRNSIYHLKLTGYIDMLFEIDTVNSHWPTW